MKTAVPAPLTELGRNARAQDTVIYCVGGAVRDALLGFLPQDNDLAGPLRPEELVRLHLPATTVLDPVNGLGTALLQLGPPADRHTFEYTAFRKDSYGRDGGHQPEDVVFTTDIHEDALRRDFTVNALYAELPDGNVLDPTGSGLADLKNRVIRMTRPDTMEEDPLRILRMVRFAAALDFETDPLTFQAARENVGRLACISKERIRDELFRILLGDTVYGTAGAVRRALYMLRDLEALPYILPELEEGRGMQQPRQYHRYDVLDHQIESAQAAPPELETRLAALLHDISKPEAFRADGNMYRHAELGEARAAAALKRLHAPRQLTKDVTQLVRHHMFDLENHAKPKAVLRRLNQLGERQFLRLADLREADFAGSGRNHDAPSAGKWRAQLAQLQQNQAPMHTAELPLSGEDLMRELHLMPGPQIGELLEKLLLYAQQHPSQNNYQSLAKYAKMMSAGSAGSGRSAPDMQ